MNKDFNEKVDQEIELEFEGGEVRKMRLLLTFEDAQENEKYVFYFDEEGESEEVFPFLYDDESEEIIELEEKRQWEKADEILQAFLAEQN